MPGEENSILWISWPGEKLKRFPGICENADYNS
jgi:hypothetical protein